MNINRHTNNLKRAAGITVNSDRGRFEYITNTSELVNAYLQNRQEIAYELKKERTRDRYILNKAGLEDAIAQSVNNNLQNAANELSFYTANAVVDNINAAFGKSCGNHASNSFATSMGRTIGKNAVELPLKLLDDILNDND